MPEHQKCRRDLESYRVYRTERSSAKRMLENDMKLKRKMLNSKNRDGSSKRYPWQKRSWMKKSESYTQEKKDGEVVHQRPTDAALTQSWWNSSSRRGAAEAWQQIQALQGELHIRFEVQHQPAPATLLHMPEGGEGADEDEEEHRKRAASRQMGQLVTGGPQSGVSELVLCLFDPTRFSGCEW